MSRFRWVALGFAFLATVINYLDRQVLSITAPELKKQFSMTDEDYGLILSMFMLAYTIANGVAGPVIDRIGTRAGYALCMLWWSTAGVLHSLARGPLSLGGCRFLLGAGEAGNWPAAVKVVSDWFSPRERALASGIFNSGSSVGALIAPPAVAWLVLKWNWQTAFAIVGLSGYLWLISWWLIYRDPGGANAVATRPAPPWRLFKTRFVSLFTLSKVFMDSVWYFYVFWFPKFLSTVHHLDLAGIGKVAWIPFLTAGIGNIAGGGVTGALIGRGVPPSFARKAAVALFAILMTSAAGASRASTVGAAVFFVSVATFGYTGYLANTICFPAEVFPNWMVGSVWGLASMGAGFGGMVFSWLSGRMIDRYGYQPVFIGYAVMPLLALILLLMAGPLRAHPEFKTGAAQ